MKQKLTMIELFSGIGAQKRGIDNTGLFDLEVISTSDIDKEAIVEYASIHHGLTNEMIEKYSDYPSKEEMAQSLTDRKIGLDFKKGEVYDWFKLAKKKKDMNLEKYWLAAKLSNNLGDISSIECLPYSDILTYSFPCTDISVAGKQKGLSKDGHTSSGLLWQVERLLDVAKNKNTLPKYLLMENVDALVSKKFKPDFDVWCNKLEELNYNTYWSILNAKECGIPQNRRRCFAISIRKDVDTGKFTFPVPFDNGLRLKDILEKKVEEKYYINTERASNLIQQLVDKGQLNGKKDDAKSILVKNQATEYSKTVDTANTLMARDWKGFGNQDMVAIVENNETTNRPCRLGNMFGEDKGTGYAGNVWDDNYISPTLTTAQGGYREPSIIETSPKTCTNYKEDVIGIKQATKKGYIECEIPGCADLSYPSSTTRRGRVQDGGQTSPTITATETGVHYIESIYRIRKLTPKECFRLMGFEFEDWDKCIEVGCSNTAGYKAAGNSIVTDCIKLLFEHLYKAQYDETYICTDEKNENFQKPEVK